MRFAPAGRGPNFDRGSFDPEIPEPDGPTTDLTSVSFRPRGHSMNPRIKSGQLCTVEPIDPSALQVDDIVLCKVRGSEYLHLVKAIQDARFQIGNNRGFINGWIGPNSIFGRLVKVED